MEGFFHKLFLTLISLSMVLTTGWINSIYNYVVMNSFFGWKCSKKEHRRKVEAVQQQVIIWAKGDKSRKLCSARPSWKSISVNKVDKSGYHQIEIGNLTDVVEIDEKNRTVTVEPGMCMGRLTRILVPKGWTIPVVPEIETLTVGGLIAGAGLETSSHKYGIFHMIATEYEIVLPSGEIVNCSNDNDPDLFHAIPGSYATIGFLTSVTLQLIPAKKFVELDYRFTSSIESALKLINEEVHNYEFIEGFAYSKDKILVMFGNMADVPKDNRKINYINLWYKKFFYLQTEQIMNKLMEDKGKKNYIEYIPIIDYYHRHSRGIFWEISNCIPLLYNSQLYMFLMGWIYPSNGDFQRFIPQWVINYWLASHIIQDYVIPLEKTAKIFHKGDELYNIYPVWICPAKGSQAPTCFKFQKKYENSIFIDLGFYGIPKQGSKCEKKQLLKYFEQLCIKCDGFQGLYADCFMSRAEFETMFDFTTYNKVRAERKCDEAFPQVYDKICANARRLEEKDAADKKH